MANVLVELGAPRRFSSEPKPEISDVLDMVARLENPVAGMVASGKQLDDAFAPAEQRAIAHLRALSIRKRHQLLKPALAQLSGSDIGRILDYCSEREIERRLRAILLEGFLKKIKKSVKKVASKVVDVVKSPVFLKVASVGAAFIPAAGPVIAKGLDKAADMVASREVVKEEVKAQKRAKEIQQNATIEAAAYAQATALASGSP